MASETVELMRTQASEKHIDLSIKLPETHLTIRGDGDRGRQMIMNLVDNAIKYTPEGGTVTVILEQEEPWNRLIVSDTGIGIAPEHQRRLFERFYRVDKGRSRQMGGTGLGLAIVKHIVFSMKGSIRVESAPNEGSRFIIDLPIAQSNGEN
jgi:two-component system phosphate regulon sensor histidine kinase PhoR